MNGHYSEGGSSASRLPGLLAGLGFGGVGGLVVGGVGGAAAGVLLAARAGKQTRSQIQKQGSKLRHQAVESMEDVVTEAGDKAHQFADSVNKGVGELQQQAQDMLGAAKK